MFLHNHLAYVREKKKAQELFIFDIGATNKLELEEDILDIEQLLDGDDLDASMKSRKMSDVTGGEQTLSENDIDNRLGLFRCKPLDLEKVISTKQAIMALKRQIYFKTIYLVGATKALLDSNIYTRLL